eukprot:TRINITY_DN10057_c0_g1_i1.p1 TRINITY_DN10057_c0_g1~~TRINITY_DN10057_c0_g1_i1.p1  ORF type:complete len:213 (+),score=22.90 TRINITY_DN10057_c0_g1_i1:276-914(+)
MMQRSFQWLTVSARRVFSHLLVPEASKIPLLNPKLRIFCFKSENCSSFAFAFRCNRTVYGSSPQQHFFATTIASTSHKQKRFLSSGEDAQIRNDREPFNSYPDEILALRKLVEQDIKENSIMVYIKGSPDNPRCGFSALAVKILQLYGVSFSWRSILDDYILKQSIKSYTQWPTFPQVFIKGEFVGGSDILLSMHQSGELKEMLQNMETVQK